MVKLSKLLNYINCWTLKIDKFWKVSNLQNFTIFQIAELSKFFNVQNG